ncbi:MAG: phage holin family protein [Roseofilum sp. SBFL]|uniref:phage holin family protein n=1 Tax=unclassified Roseofilum TaxID=2620099 RepID=UPI001B237A11|nr:MULTISPECIES: phage holin family protein [unclassified Roseofilum]MBP0013685.1 phage holin family protein [Roseofilum sp. SID3]MBP0023475.1 phage holin family protein [Roseofilum sp. SID2]MBP0037217.1 phage holin family protein [Roseofilum sp. SID1]MBP0040940.1 phage holin family protein [Roseofilum sp. SBFL]
MAVHELLDGLQVYLTRGVRLLRVLVDMHQDLAVREATQEQQRLIQGLLILLVGTGLLMTGIALLQVTVVVTLQHLGLGWLGAIALTALVDLLFGLILMQWGSQRLQGPYMRETRDRLLKTTQTLLQDDPDAGYF